MARKQRTPEEAAKFVQEVIDLCSRNYQNGGDTIIECFENSEILEMFETLEDVRRYCGMKAEQALNCRWGEDSDPERAAYERYMGWEP